MKSKKGFTLIELLVVVLIIGILAAIAVPQYKKAVGKSQTREAILTLKTITNAEEVYYLATGNYTDNLSNLDVSITESDKYEYVCFLKGYKSCIALPKKDGLPVLEFCFSKNQDYPNSQWCQIADKPMSAAAKEKALEICRSLGPIDSRIQDRYGHEYHFVQ